MSERIPQAAPVRAYQAHRTEFDDAIRRVLDRGTYVLGPEVAAFESEFEAVLGVGYAVGVASGTDALELSLRALGIGTGQGVITVSHTAVATAAAIERAGAVPILVDIDPDTFTMDVDAFASAARIGIGPRGERISAVVPVHLYGQMADMPAIVEIARQNGLVVIEDCAQAQGASISGHPAGTWGDAAAFSFYPTKNLAAFGDAGLLIARDRAVAERAMALRQYGWDGDRVSRVIGVNSRLDEIQAAVLRIGLRHLDAENARRQAIAHAYDRISLRQIQLPAVRAGAVHVYHQYVIRSRHRDDLRLALSNVGVGTGIHYPSAIHQQPAYANRLARAGSFRVTELVVEEVLSLPMFGGLSDNEVARVVGAIESWTPPRA